MDDLREDGVLEFYGLAWKRPDGSCPAQTVLESLGLEVVVELPGFWTADSEAEGYDCLVCGNPCVCFAAVMCTGTAPTFNFSETG